MAGITGWRILLGLTASGFLAACVETSGTGETGASAGGAGKLRAGAEVEAPEVFQANESALWDGRPSLGGIWVASPDAVDPERVVMFNPATGKSVKGALFRRERDNPGPRLQLSSDAAEALGVLAGMPTEIQVTALRKVEVVEEPVAALEADPAAAGAEVEGAEEAAQGTGADQDAAAVAAAALDAVDAGAATEAVAAGAETVAEVDPAAADATAEEEPKRKTWKEKRAEAKAAREAKKAAEAAEAAAATAAAAGEADPEPTAESAGVTEIESAPLDVRKPEVANGDEDAALSVGAAAAEETAPDAAGSSAPAGDGAMRTIQIGSFSKEDNANRAVEALSKIGISARIQKSERNGKSVWGVVANGDQAMLKKIQDAGFADAYFLK